MFGFVLGIFHNGAHAATCFGQSFVCNPFLSTILLSCRDPVRRAILGLDRWRSVDVTLEYCLYGWLTFCFVSGSSLILRLVVRMVYFGSIPFLYYPHMLFVCPLGERPSRDLFSLSEALYSSSQLVILFCFAFLELRLLLIYT